MMKGARLAATAITVYATLVLVALLGVYFTTAERLVHLDHLWSAYNNDTTLVADALHTIESQMGYGGFIHQFKNYVLRRDPELLARATRNIDNTRKAIHELETLKLESSEHEALSDLKQVVEQYQARIELAGNADVRALPGESLDGLLRVNDTPALEAIALLIKATQARAGAQQRATTQSLDNILSQLRRDFLLLPLIVVLAYILIRFLRRVTRANERISAAHQQLNAILEHAPDAMLTLDTSGRLLSANARAEQLFGLSRSQLEHTRVDHLLRATEHSGSTEILRLLTTPGQHRLNGCPRDGQSLPLEVGCNTVVQDGAVVVIVTIHDLRDRLRAEQAEQADRVKSEFLSHMGHEFRTPLNIISGFTELVLEDEDPLTASQRECLEHVHEAGASMLSLVEDLLTFSRVRAGGAPPELENVAISDIVTRGREALYKLAEQYQVELEVDPRCEDLWVHADANDLGQVLRHLLTNSIKYSRSGGAIRIDCTPAARPGYLRLNVSDSGEGIPADRVDEVFKPFNRLGREGSSISGAGIGLALCKHLVERMHGRIGVHSDEGQGTVFWMELQRADSASDAAATPLTSDAPVAQVAAHRYRILLIEDDEYNREYYLTLLNSRPNIEAIGAVSGKAGLKEARKQKPDLILLDIHLPDMDGYEVLRRLRGEAETADTSVVAITAEREADDIERGLRAGFNDYLTKPIQGEALLRAVEAKIPRA